MADFLTSAIPFLFVLAVVYGALDVSGVLKNRGVNALIAVVVSFFAISNQQMVDFIHGVLPYALVLFIVVFFFAFIKSLFKGEKGGEKDYVPLSVVLALVLIFLASQQSLLNIQNQDTLILIGVIIIIILFYAAYKKGSK
jgi:hypothetical protein